MLHSSLSTQSATEIQLVSSTQPFPTQTVKLLSNNGSHSTHIASRKKGFILRRHYWVTTNSNRASGFHNMLPCCFAFDGHCTCNQDEGASNKIHRASVLSCCEQKSIDLQPLPLWTCSSMLWYCMICLRMFIWTLADTHDNILQMNTHSRSINSSFCLLVYLSGYWVIVNICII